MANGHDVSSYDFTIYWQPYCSGFSAAGVSLVGGTVSLMNMPAGNTVKGAAAVLAHELGHNFGAKHASCISDAHRGAVAWCDSDVTKSSDKNAPNACDVSAATWTDYCSPYSIMGEPGEDGLTRPFYMDGKLIFDWADSVNHPALVSTIDWDVAANKYPGCDPSCTFDLQRSDDAALDDSRR